VNWETYKTTVDAVELLSGYDLLALLPDRVEGAVESATKPPLAATDGPYTAIEGSAIAMSAAGSVDFNGSIVSYEWTFGDGSTGSGVSTSHVYAQDGVYTVRLVVTDNDGLTDAILSTAVVVNVAPAIASFAGATLLPGETFSRAGTFTDPGSDTWSATVDYGDGSGVNPLALSGKSFTLSHTYPAAGTFTVTVRVSDDDATSMRTQTVTVITPLVGVQNALQFIDQLVMAGKVSAGNANSLQSKLDAAAKQIERGNSTPAISQLGAALNEIDAMERSGRLSAADAASLRDLVRRVQTSLGG
jgi:hypothetical protein